MTMKPGLVPRDDTSGELNKFKDSMAEAIENAFKAEWLRVKGEPLPDVGEKDRRIFFVAVAKGVIDHMTANAEVLIDHTHEATAELVIHERSYNQLNPTHSHSSTITITVDEHVPYESGKVIR